MESKQGSDMVEEVGGDVLASEVSTTVEAPSAGLLLQVWLGIGVQSFGGGIATLALIRQAVTERHKWMTDIEFTRDWALVQIAPGINLLALTILIGRRVRGIPGIFISLIGLLLPSVTIALLLTACYARVQGLAEVKAALKGIFPAVIGLGLLTSVQLARSLLTASEREGKGSLTVSVLLLLFGALGMAVWHTPVIVMILVGGAIGAIWQWQYAARKHAKEAARP